MPTEEPKPCARCVILEKEVEQLRGEVKRVDELHREVGELRTIIEKLRRDRKRQSAPFSKGAPILEPKKPGRKPGAEYGPKARRPIPEKVDEVVAAPVPCACPDCGGEIEVQKVEPQWETDLPKIEVHVTRFDVQVGRCRACSKVVRGSHPRQTTQAGGAAASHVGPNARALAVELHHGVGASWGKVARLLRETFGLNVTPGALVQSSARVARVADPAYEALITQVARSPIVSPDETGWRVGGLGAWLWAFATPDLSVYAITPGRGFEDACMVLPAEYGGILARDGWDVYRRFDKALHQTCLAHIGRRTHEILETARRGAARVPRALQGILRAAFSIRDRRDAGELEGHGLRVAIGKLDARLDRFVASSPVVDENRRLVRHIAKQHRLGAITRFLHDPDVPATNHWAEQAIRPAVVNRKVWGGNRTWRGAEAQEVLMSVSATLRKRGIEPVEALATTLRLSRRDHLGNLLARMGTGPAP